MTTTSYTENLLQVSVLLNSLHRIETDDTYVFLHLNVASRWTAVSEAAEWLPRNWNVKRKIKVLIMLAKAKQLLEHLPPMTPTPARQEYLLEVQLLKYALNNRST